MTMGKWKLCVRWSACLGSPSSISLACFKQEELTKVMFLSFSNGKLAMYGSTFENGLDRSRISFRKRPCTMYKDNAIGNVVAETGRDLVFGTTARLSDL